MKKILIILFSFLIVSCFNSVDYKVSQAEYKSYVVSSKKENSTGDGYVFFQTPTSTEKVRLNYEDFKKIRERDTIMVLTRYIKENE